MAKFRKKPVVIEAFQWMPELGAVGGVFFTAQAHAWSIVTLEGIMHVSPGDWIITGIKGERYACKPDIFEMTYEPVE